MTGPNVAEDIKPVSEFRARSAALIAQVQQSRRPLILTQHGRGSVVVLDVHEFEAMREEIELLRDLGIAERQIDGGHGVSHDDAKRRIFAAVDE
ncbi:MAG: prevent-host-death family protein [Acidobacteria bacterium]|nr:MAG: prevent-host-death family protein [Acidobacteriota bacterium]RLE26155.1 MAG: prevent-host-death family protein [Acidobacteriota bacterium]